MLLPRLTNCPDCSDALSLINDIDCKLSETSNILYNNIVFMLGTPICKEDILDLLHYKRILTYKYCNYNYVSDFKIKQIASKIKLLTLGCVKGDCIKNTTTTTTIPPTTTTTTTISPTTTTTTTVNYDCDLGDGTGVIIAGGGVFDDV
jgi:hypothetical protein